MLYCMHWLQHSINGIVNDRLPVKKLICSGYIDEQIIVEFISRMCFIRDGRLFLPLEFCNILENLLSFVFYR